MTTVLAERNGWIYAKETTTDFFEPRLIVHWWPTGVRWHDFAQWFADETRARSALGGELYPTSNASYQDCRGWPYRLTNGGQTKPDHTDLVPLAPPKQERSRYIDLAQARLMKYTQTELGRNPDGKPGEGGDGVLFT